MLDMTNLTVFLIAAWSLNLTPGPDMLYVVTRSVARGRMAGVVSSLGVATGGLIHTAAAALGLSVILANSAVAFLIVKYVGAAYLIYLGIVSCCDKKPLERNGIERDSNSLARLYYQGLITNVLNPKVALFFLSFLPQFTNPAAGSVFLQIIVLGSIFNVSGSSILVLVAVFSGYAGGWIERNPYLRKLQRWLTGSILVALGLRLAVQENRP